MPITPIRLVVDHRGRDRTDEFPVEGLNPILTKGDPRWIREKSAVLKNVVPPLLKKAEELAEGQSKSLRKAAEKAMTAMLGEELARLKALRKLGHPIREEELKASEAERDALAKSFGGARVRLDALRLVLLQP